MNFKFAMIGLAALGGAVMTSGTASAAIPNGLVSGAEQSSNVESVRLVCDVYGRCFRRPNYYYGGPRYYPRPRFYGGYGYGRPRYYGGYRRW